MKQHFFSEEGDSMRNKGNIGGVEKNPE